jgi:hypothetical protein
VEFGPSGGPQTVTIARWITLSQQLDPTLGKYRYSVAFMPSGPGEEDRFVASGATVRVYDHDDLLATITPRPDARGTLWTVLEIYPRARGFDLVPVNEVTSLPPTPPAVDLTVLAPPAGTAVREAELSSFRHR